MSRTILVVDDDPHIREVVVFALEKGGFRSEVAIDGRQALSKAEGSAFDLIVLDISMPEMDGLEVCKALRRHSNIPILFLSSRDEEVDRVLGLELGADDYLTKPFSPRELVARVKAILKRSVPVMQGGKSGGSTVTCGGLSVDTDRHTVCWNGVPVSLTVTEFSIVQGMAQYPERVFERDQIMTMARGANTFVSDRTIDSHIRNIRRKFAEKGCDNLITTLRGIGYKLTP
ncbi:MAG: response regulator transcription factor [Alphaproteobacteria bacterium]|nr:response regulator transcription factor [Alphaproteobacteria bacterium]MCB9975697.1 response regulator transcription factor [Rhodospirillales bacterium]